MTCFLDHVTHRHLPVDRGRISWIEYVEIWVRREIIIQIENFRRPYAVPRWKKAVSRHLVAILICIVVLRFIVKRLPRARGWQKFWRLSKTNNTLIENYVGIWHRFEIILTVNNLLFPIRKRQSRVCRGRLSLYSRIKRDMASLSGWMAKENPRAMGCSRLYSSCVCCLLPMPFADRS